MEFNNSYNETQQQQQQWQQPHRPEYSTAPGSLRHNPYTATSSSVLRTACGKFLGIPLNSSSVNGFTLAYAIVVFLLIMVVVISFLSSIDYIRFENQALGWGLGIFLVSAGFLTVIFVSRMAAKYFAKDRRYY